jgi:ankyrin repeat protein
LELLKETIEKGNSEIATVLLPLYPNLSDDTLLKLLHLPCAKGDTDIVRLLLARWRNTGRNPDPDSIADFYGTACKYGYVDIVSLLLDAGADPKCSGYMYVGTSPLSLALVNGHTAVVQRIRAAGVKLNLTKISVLQKAAAGGCVDIIREALAAQPRTPTALLSALSRACEYGRTEAASLLLSALPRSSVGLSPKAVRAVRDALCVALCKGFDPVHAHPLFTSHFAGPGANDLLLFASGGGCLGAMGALLDNGANPSYMREIDHPEDPDITMNACPLANASTPEAVALLLEAKADARPRRPVDLLEQSCTRLQPRSVELLVAAKANVDGCGLQPPLCRAIWTKCPSSREGDRTEVVRLLIAGKASLEAVTRENGSALHACVYNLCRKRCPPPLPKPLLKLLSPTQRVLDATDCWGATALGLAAQLGNYTMVRFLLARGARVDVGKTPLVMAAVEDPNEGRQDDDWGGFDIMRAFANLDGRDMMEDDDEDEDDRDTRRVDDVFGLKADIVTAVLKAGADPTLADTEGVTVLMRLAGWVGRRGPPVGDEDASEWMVEMLEYVKRRKVQ